MGSHDMYARRSVTDRGMPYLHTDGIPRYVLLEERKARSVRQGVQDKEGSLLRDLFSGISSQGSLLRDLFSGISP
jgi:hypothetical protein